MLKSTSPISNFVLILLCWGWFQVTCAQDQQRFTLQIVPTFQGERVALSSALDQWESHPISFTTCRFYLGQFSLYHGPEEVWQVSQPYHLYDLGDSTSHLLSFSLPAGISYDQVRFTLGVDSSTSASGIFGGDLDPMNGMYWSWNSGYIHIKIEGFSPVVDSKKHQFLFHIGGYLAPHTAAQNVSMPIQAAGTYTLLLDLSQLINTIDLSETYHIMSPSKKGVHFAQSMAQSFRLDAVEK